MAKQRKGDVVTILMIIGGIIISLSIVVVGIFVYQSVRWGPCWANFGQEMADIEQGFEKLKVKSEETPGRVSVTLSECVGALIFADSGDLDKIDSDFRKELKCPEGEGFVIGFPSDEETKSGWRFWLWPKDLWENVVRWWKGKGRDIGPLCRSLDKGVNSLDIEGPGDGKTRTVCLELIKKTNGDYGVSYEEGACA